MTDKFHCSSGWISSFFAITGVRVPPVGCFPACVGRRVKIIMLVNGLGKVRLGVH